MERSVEEIAAKMDALGIWSAVFPYNLAVKPRGTVFPYFCMAVKDDNPLVKVRVVMLEGWQTLHDFIRTRVDPNFGFHSRPADFRHFELLYLADGAIRLLRHDTGYVPISPDATGRALVARILWEIYGIMLRLESDPQLPMRFASEKSVFARVETAPNVWVDQPLEIPDPPPHVEKVAFPREDIRKAKDLPFAHDEVMHVDFRIDPRFATKDARPRTVYTLKAYDPAKHCTVFERQAVFVPDAGGLKGLWESMPPNLLKSLIQYGRIPGSLKVSSGRVFRLLRPLGLELPFKLSLHNRLEGL